MRIQSTKQLPSLNELKEILSQRFSGQYSVKTFGAGRKSILVGKSTLIGAEISIHKNEVSIASSPPSVFGGILMTLGMTELALFIFPFFFKHKSGYRTLEREIGLFLQHQYC
ncbi:MAG TPA: hypothetical protein DCE41_20255 [Cytophagales bacterium]|nr:hypothetical protein [Cytophagales bacterium]HAA20641.1 hypothetical protein [Cytophagales bacterium]HAP61546.1 hypothetical protein [Cytophagales bacterium]